MTLNSIEPDRAKEGGTLPPPGEHQTIFFWLQYPHNYQLYGTVLRASHVTKRAMQTEIVDTYFGWDSAHSLS